MHALHAHVQDKSKKKNIDKYSALHSVHKHYTYPLHFHFHANGIRYINTLLRDRQTDHVYIHYMH